MKFAVIQFLGSNCDMDMLCALRDVLGEQAEYVPASQTSLAGFDAVMLPGGFSYGDYLRSGAIARFAPIMAEVKRFVDEGKLVFGTCNGFQILVEAGFLPGAFLRNTNLHFVCKWQPLRVVNNTTAFSSAFAKNQIITLPIAHGEGNFITATRIHWRTCVRTTKLCLPTRVKIPTDPLPTSPALPMSAAMFLA